MTATALKSAPSTRKEPPAEPRIESSCLTSLMESVEKYLDLMYDGDTSRFDEVFCSTVRLHGFRDGKMKAWSVEAYKDILNKRQSPKSQNAPREDEILFVDFVSNSGARESACSDLGDGIRRLSDLASH